MQAPAIPVGEFLEKNRTAVRLDPGSDPTTLERRVSKKRLQKLGMALAGFTEYIQEGRIYVFGNTEASFCRSRSADQLVAIAAGLSPRLNTAILVTNELDLPPVLAAFARAQGVPVLRTDLDSSTAIYRLTEFLEMELSPRMILHGLLMDVYGLGVLMGGESGIGKSECALELILRGHRLVADDVVDLRNVGGKHLIGESPPPVQNLLELRGIGILNVREMFGVSAVTRIKEVVFYIHLERWLPEKEYDRLGLAWQRKEIFGVELPSMSIPVAPGRNLSVLVEVACRVFLMRSGGRHPMGELYGALTDTAASAAAEEEAL
jgi:HPr kinase/phosphorylase